MNRPKAYFINGGAGRTICSIPAFENLLEKSKDFIIVCEGGTDFFKGHPTLHEKVFDHWHKNLFEDYIKDKDIISPEPYRIWEYYNQKCSLSQAFDIAINNEGIRPLTPPNIYLNKYEVTEAFKVIKEVQEKTGKEKVVVVQPFGRGVINDAEFVSDYSSRSMHLNDAVNLINQLKQKYAVILMSEFPIVLEENNNQQYPVAMPTIPDIRIWAGIIEISDYFVGCDSVGQHIARSFSKPSSIVFGSTFPINVSYPDFDKFQIIDIGEKTRRYSPIRISLEEHIERLNDNCMEMSKEIIKKIINKIEATIGVSKTLTKIPKKEKFEISNGSLTSLKG